ncbi:hypothetical protein RIR_jg31990.t1 [Rhizophagus irregularis DAOM 181602=DAOM 197198]|nr:hypothetical protein RIR_jg31990.t1 [Rhizophagus irregularis DAOM 181602=DAOM 197198]
MFTFQFFFCKKKNLLKKLLRMFMKCFYKNYHPKKSSGIDRYILSLRFITLFKKYSELSDRMLLSNKITRLLMQ